MQCARLVIKMNTKFITKLFITLLILLIAAPIISVGCKEEEERELPPPSPSELSSTLVPNTHLDLYIYGKQDNPTMIPARLVDTSHDVGVESLAVWGVPEDDDFAIGMSATLTNASDASKLYAEITLEADGWKKLSDNTVYLVRGSGTVARALKTAISNNDFKTYDDSDSLKAVATLPNGGATKLAAIALIKPRKTLSGLPGLIVEPAVKKLLTEQEFIEINLGGLTLYKGSWNSDDRESIPVLVRIEGNHIFAAVSGQESYAETLITSIQVE